LRQTDDAPAALFLVGDPGVLVRPQVAIVGSAQCHARRPRSRPLDFAATLARAGFVVTSGLAAGMDARAHEGCLDAGGP
jgi:DNA processing protein